MSKLKRQRLTIKGDAQVTAIGSDAIDPAADVIQDDNAGSTDRKEERQRSLFVHSLPASTTTESLTSLFSESYPLKHATVVVDPVTKQSKGFGFVTFTDVDDAQSARQAFNGALVDGKKIKTDLAKPRTRQGHPSDSQSLPDLSSSLRPEKEQSHEKPPRLIVRNLPWSIKDADQLATLFRSFGKVKHASMPKRGPGLSAGFGFVLLRGKKNAGKAMEALNGKEIDGRAIAVDWAVDKDTWINLNGSAQITAEADEAHEGDHHQEEIENMISDRENDVNQADSHNDGVQDLAGPQDRLVDGEAMEEDGLDDDDDDADDDDAFDDDEDHNEEAEESADSEEEDHQYEDKTTTLFIRNLPFTATDDSLFEHFKHFGGIRYARTVMDPATERSKGVGFVCFYDEQAADACIRSAPRVQLPNDKQKKGSSASSTKQSLLEDVSIDRSGKYTLDGRVLSISRAVDRKEATRLTFANSSLREARDKDRRRLYLLAEGNVPSNSPLHKQLSPAEIKMREDSAKQRQSLIKTNPSLHLSLTRLSVRNLPRSVDSKALKSLAREAAVGFAKDVKAGLRKPLTKEELSRGGVEMREAEQARKSKGKGIVRQAKIVFEGREGTKVAEDSGAGRSRGYGFIEYSSHRWALMGLRWLNAHAVEPSTESSTGPIRERKKRLIVEFAIENAQVVMRRHEKEAKARETSKTVQEKRQAGELPEKQRVYSKAQLMAKTRKGTKRPQKNNSLQGTPGESSEAAEKVETAESKLAKRQQIIGRKRMLRRNKAKRAA